jgi:hypothetical protein
MSNAGGQRICIMKIFTLNSTTESKVSTHIIGVCEQLISNMLELRESNYRRLQRLHNEKPHNLYNNKQKKTNTSKLTNQVTNKLTD